MSAPMPPPPNLLGIALQAQAQRRQAEQDRLNQLMMVENLRSNAIRLGQDAIAQGHDFKDIRGMLSYSDPIVEANLKAMESARNKNAEREAQRPQVDYLRGNLQDIARFPNAEGIVNEQAPSPEAAAELLPLLQTIQGIAPYIGAAEEEDRASALRAKIEETSATEAEKSEVRVGERRRTKAIDEAFESRRLAAENLIYAAARGDEAALASPVIQSVPYAADRIAAEKARMRIQDSPLRDAEAELRTLGVPIEVTPRSKIRGYAASDKDGKYVEPSVFKSSQTGLLMNGRPGTPAMTSFQTLEATLTQLNTVEAVIEVARSARGDTTKMKRVTEWLRTKIRDGDAAGDLSMIEALRAIGATPIARNVGQEKGASTEQDVSRVLEALPNVMEALAKDPNTYRGRLESARRGAMGQLNMRYGAEYPRSVWLPRVKRARTLDTARAKNEVSQLFGAPFSLTPEEVRVLQEAGE